VSHSKRRADFRAFEKRVPRKIFGAKTEEEYQEDGENYVLLSFVISAHQEISFVLWNEGGLNLEM
jgi:hypothetical protein